MLQNWCNYLYSCCRWENFHNWYIFVSVPNWDIFSHEINFVANSNTAKIIVALYKSDLPPCRWWLSSGIFNYRTNFQTKFFFGIQVFPSCTVSCRCAHIWSFLWAFNLMKIFSMECVKQKIFNLRYSKFVAYKNLFNNQVCVLYGYKAIFLYEVCTSHNDFNAKI